MHHTGKRESKNEKEKKLLQDIRTRTLRVRT